MKKQKANKLFDKDVCNELVKGVRSSFCGINSVLDHPLIKGSIVEEEILFGRGIVYAACYAYEESCGSIEYPSLRSLINSLVRSVEFIEDFLLENDLEAFKEHKKELRTLKKRLITLDSFIKLT